MATRVWVEICCGEPGTGGVRILEIIDLTKRYEGGVLAVDRLNLKVGPGEIFVMLGANGASKTTTVNLIFNLIQPTSGMIKIKGIDAVKNPLEARKNAAFVSEDVRLYEGI